MIREIGNFEVDSSDWEFRSLQATEKVHDGAFKIQNALRVNFDDQGMGSITFRAIKPEISDPFYRITPINMGAARWYSIGCDIPRKELLDTDQIIPCLDAAIAQPATLFAILRIFYVDGQHEDIRSRDVKLTRNRKNHSFPISLSELSAFNFRNVKSARLIFIIQSRDIAIDIFSLTTIALSKKSNKYAEDDIAHLRTLFDQGTESLQMQALNSSTENLWTGKTHEHRAIVKDNIFLSLDSGEDRNASVIQKPDGIDLDFTEAASGKWRSLEFRFANVVNSGSMVAVVNAIGRSTTPNALGATLALRQYDEKFAWEDTLIPEPFNLFPKTGSQLRAIDLSPLLSDKRNVHRIGFMILFPPRTRMLEIKEMNVFVFDREKV